MIHQFLANWNHFRIIVTFVNLKLPQNCMHQHLCSHLLAAKLQRGRGLGAVGLEPFRQSHAVLSPRSIRGITGVGWFVLKKKRSPIGYANILDETHWYSMIIQIIWKTRLKVTFNYIIYVLLKRFPVQDTSVVWTRPMPPDIVLELDEIRHGEKTQQSPNYHEELGMTQNFTRTWKCSAVDHLTSSNSWGFIFWSDSFQTHPNIMSVHFWIVLA